MATAESTSLLTFFQTIFPEELYAIPAASEQPAPPAGVVPETPASTPPATPVAAGAATAPPSLPAAPAASPESSAPPMPAPTPAFVSGTTHQQSRGDGSGAVVVQRLPAAEFGQLNQAEFWQNFLRYLKLDWPKVRFVNVLTATPLPLPELLASAPGTPRLLLFGSGLVSPLPPEAPAYERYPLPDGPELLRAHAIADLTPERKRLLLAAVAPWVGAGQ